MSDSTETGMSVTVLLWLAIGSATGASHAAALWRTARRSTHAEWGFLWRLPIVATTLVVAALVGRLVPAAIGWAAGLGVTAVILLVSQGRWK